ncbi:FHIPEP family type III secretion protein [Vibrio vulnificus]|nr:FHIPEP family type III secretion protein [Vibrio vulnificus]
MNFFKQYVLKDWHSNLFIIGVVLILMVIFLPLPAYVLDFLQIVNFSVALLILLLTFCTDKPLSFSTFPSIILIATLFRLALNISATRLILGEGDAGQVISAIGEFVVSGNYVIGFIVFIILIVVQYVVVTNGAQRVAEVAARFTLDSMPGKQMAIDADMNMGLIDEQQAKERRANIEREANFYGTMDGATKFVKGDAIAGIIIILIDIIGGISVGVSQHALTWEEALAKYSLLTVGDGIVTQIPSLIIAVATGIIITRAATDYELSKEIGRQVASHPRTLLMVMLALVVSLFLEGLPKSPILLVIVMVAGSIWWAVKHQGELETDGADSDETSEKEDLKSYLKIYPLQLSLGTALHEKYLSNEWTLKTRLEALKKQVTIDYGYILPTVNITLDDGLDAFSYCFSIHGSNSGKGSLDIERSMVIGSEDSLSMLNGEKAKEPAYGLPAKWIDEETVSLAKKQSLMVVPPEIVLFTHMSEAIKNNLHEVLSRKDIDLLLLGVKEENSNLLLEVIPTILNTSEFLQVLRMLLKEKVSIKYIELILESIAENASENGKNIEFLIEKIREKLASRICERYLDKDEQLNVITMTPQLEVMFKQVIGNDIGDGKVEPAVVENVLKQLISQCDSLLSKGIEPVLLCPSQIRAPLRKITERIAPKLAVISAQEISGIRNVKTIGKLSHV